MDIIKPRMRDLSLTHRKPGSAHKDLASLLKESLPEYLNIAGLCISTQKGGGGVYGFPSALLLFTIVDTIGSCHRGDKSCSVTVNDKNRSINGDDHKHYFALNSKYYNQVLSEDQIKKVYDYYRCLLSHNASLPPGFGLELGAIGEPLFGLDAAGSIRSVRLRPFYDQSVSAVTQFLQRVESVLSTSYQAAVINKKSPQ